MSIILVGLNHRTAPIDVRERLAFTDAASLQAVRQLVDGDVLQEGLIVSTCNRVEVLGAVRGNEFENATRHVRKFLTEDRELPPDYFNDRFYAHVDDRAIHHVFRVASSLDSMVVGEPQILGQFRHAYSIALRAGTAGRVLHRLVSHALRVAKRVRNETGIAASAVSISYMAVELGRKIFGSLKDRSVLLVGAGEMAELSARHLVKAGASRVLIANRTKETAGDLARQIGGLAVDFDQLATHLSESDVVICSTGSPDYVITPEMAKRALETRSQRPIFFIDISVPRNVDPLIGEMSNLFVFDIDDLESVIESNIRERERESQRAELIVESEVMQFQQALRSLDIGPTLGALRSKMHDIARAEMGRHRHRMGSLTSEQEKALEAMLTATVNKLSHPVLHRMRESYSLGETDEIQAWRELFGLEE